MTTIFKQDLFRINGNTKWSIFRFLKSSDTLRFIYFFRKRQQAHNWFTKKIYSLRLRSLSKKTHIDISPKANIGPGLMIVHKGFITIGSAILGKNITLSSGVVIGEEFRGKRQGCPTIGNNVYIGANATIVGNIQIGDDVLIAPGAFVNFNVPSHSIVLGNPGIIKHKDNATEYYQTYVI